jgi:hypothetical protein
VTTLTAVPRASGRGRQAAGVEAQRDFREELTAHLAESRDFAERVKVGSARIRAAISVGSDLAAMNEAGKLSYHADRRLEQLGSVVL